MAQQEESHQSIMWLHFLGGPEIYGEDEMF